MRKSHGNELLRAQVNSSWLYRVFNIVFLVLFAVVVLLVIIDNPGVQYRYSPAMLAACAAAGTLVIFLVSRLFSVIPKPNPIAEKIIVVLLLAILLAGQVYIGRALLFDLSPASDYGRVFHAARDYVLGNPDAGAVLSTYPRDAGLYMLWCGFFSILRLFGLTNFYFPAMVLNAAAITASVLLLFFCVRRMFGPNKSLFVLVGAFFILPFVAGAALPCAETLLLPVPIAAVMIWLRARSQWRRGEIKPAVIRVCVASALLGAGALVKMSVLVVWVAMAIDLLVFLCGKGRLRLLLASFLSMAVVFFAASFAFWLSPPLPAFSMSERMPEPAYVLAGFAEPGTGAADYERLEGFRDAGQRTAIAESAIGERVAELGAAGFIVHLMDRLSYVFGDGSYSFAGAYTGVLPSVFKDVFASSGAYFTVTAYVVFAVAAGLLVWMAVGAFKAIYRGNDAFTFLRVAVFGLTLFMLFWDSGPRWLVTLLPLMVLCALEAAPVPQPAKAQAAWGRRGPESRTQESSAGAEGRLDYMHPSFGLVRDESLPGRGDPVEPPPEYTVAPAATGHLEPVSNSDMFMPPEQPLPNSQLPGTLWEFMEDEPGDAP